jgi:hypothetical protein
VALASAGLALLLLVSWVLLHQRERAAAAAPAITIQGDTLHIAENAPQWRYVELSVAQQAPALPPPPVPGRVDFDEKRTASLSAPLAGRVEKVQVRVGDRVKEGDRLFNVRSAAWADLEREMASARANVEVNGGSPGPASWWISGRAGGPWPRGRGHEPALGAPRRPAGLLRIATEGAACSGWSHPLRTVVDRRGGG